MAIKQIGVVGAGVMGSGIAQAFALAGLPVVVIYTSEAAREKALATISGSMDRMIKKETLTDAQKMEALVRISMARDLALLAECDLLIEAVTEN